MDPRVRTVVFRSLLKISGLSIEATLRCCVRCWGPFGLAQRLGGERRSRGDRPTGDPRFCLTSLGDTARSASGPYQLVATSATLPFRSRQARPSRGFGPMAGTRCRFSPRDRVTKSRTRRYQRSNIPPTERQDGNSMPHSPAPRKRDFGKLKCCARGAQRLTRDARRETRAETRRRETMRQCGFATVSSSHVSARLSPHVRAHTPHFASGGHVRGTSLIAICDVPGTGREITVRNVCFLLADLDGTFFVQKSVKILRPFKIQPRLDVM